MANIPFLNNAYFSAKVGIGTDSPERLLSLYSDNAETTPRLLIEQDGTGDAVMAFSLTSGQGWSMGIDNSGGDAFMIHNSAGGVDSSSQFVILNSGNVGIGTISPGAKLEVASSSNPSIKIQDTTDGYAQKNSLIFDQKIVAGQTEVAKIYTELFNGTTTTLNNPLKFATAQRSTLTMTDRMVIDNLGNVGIGTAAAGPNQRLQVQTATTTDSSFQGINVHNNGTTGTRAGICFQGYDWVQSAIWHGRGMTPTSESGALVLGTNPNTTDLTVSGVVARMVINNAGAIKFNAYGAGTLVTDASGNITVSSGGGAGGPYLPLAGGTMTGTITMSNNRITSIEELRFNNGGNIDNQINTDVDTGTETVANVAIATYTAAFFDFVIKKTTNVRSGTVYACHDGTNVEFTETSTQDLGDTSDVTLSVDISGTNMRLLATVTSDDWSVKSLIRAI